MKKLHAFGFTLKWRKSLMTSIGLLFVLFLGFSGCRPAREIAAPATGTTESGLEYTITYRGNGKAAEKGDMVSLHYIGKLEDGSEFDSSFERGEPVSFRLSGGQVIPGLEEAISLLREGDKATLVIPPELAYGENAFGPVPSNAYLTYEIELLSVISPKESLEVEGVDKLKTPGGVEYAIVEKGSGKRLTSEMHVKVHYTGYFEDESIFDSSYERDHPIEFILGRGMVIPGWEEGLQNLRVGDKARMWIPYQMAYGEQGRRPIPPETDLFFDIEVLEARAVEKPKPFEVEGKDTLTTHTGLQMIFVEEGEGDHPEPGHELLVHYSGYLTDGTLFDSSVQRGEPFRFILGQRQVIRGWDEGFALMRKGTRARLIVPPNLAYGERQMGPISPGSTLVFDVVLIDFK